jgi:hypothetical protein
MEVDESLYRHLEVSMPLLVSRGTRECASRRADEGCATLQRSLCRARCCEELHESLEHKGYGGGFGGGETRNSRRCADFCGRAPIAAWICKSLLAVRQGLDPMQVDHAEWLRSVLPSPLPGRSEPFECACRCLDEETHAWSSLTESHTTG